MLNEIEECEVCDASLDGQARRVCVTVGCHVRMCEECAFTTPGGYHCHECRKDALADFVRGQFALEALLHAEAA